MLNKKINKDSSLPRCATVSLGESFPTFLRNIMSATSRVKAEQEEEPTKNKCRRYICMVRSVSGHPEKIAIQSGRGTKNHAVSCGPEEGCCQMYSEVVTTDQPQELWVQKWYSRGYDNRIGR